MQENKQHRDLQNVTCYRCGQLGHLANRCTNNAAKSGAVTEKKFNQCFVAEPKGVMTHQVEIFPICFDSGAECSLMRSSAADKFDGKLINIVIIRGIGDSGISSKLQKLSQIDCGVLKDIRRIQSAQNMVNQIHNPTYTLWGRKRFFLPVTYFPTNLEKGILLYE